MNYFLIAVCILALAAGGLAVWALLKARNVSLIDMAEFRRLDGKIKGVYRKQVVHKLAPRAMENVNMLWKEADEALRKEQGMSLESLLDHQTNMAIKHAESKNWRQSVLRDLTDSSDRSDASGWRSRGLLPMPSPTATSSPSVMAAML